MAYSKESLVGRRFGKMRVLEDLGTDRLRKRIYLCVCSCGARFQRYRHNILAGGETQSCVECAKRRNTNRLSEDMRETATKLYPWTTRILAKWYAKYPNMRDEILSAAHEGLVIAVRDYKPCYTQNFEKWCVYRIFRKVRVEMHKEIRYMILKEAVVAKEAGRHYEH